MASYRLRETIEGIQWLGTATPQEDVEWVEGLPGGKNNVRSVNIVKDRLELSTGLTSSTLDPSDYLAIGGNGHPIVMPKEMFEAKYEEV